MAAARPTSARMAKASSRCAWHSGPGKGMIRRPDVIIVQNPNRPPTQDNIKQVVEMKFPPDPRNTKQTEACKKIAGSENKVVDMQATDGFYPVNTDTLRIFRSLWFR
ncbi:VRR-NUC domain-containing protein [Pseudomonas aeruginosa]|uniref:VRR-NUC domain-containing protein n=1 Tax=Pseudomonas aeruginosa TaxID=287 RepID=UPI00387E2CF0